MMVDDAKESQLRARSTFWRPTYEYSDRARRSARDRLT